MSEPLDMTESLLALIARPSRRDDVVPLYSTVLLYAHFAKPQHMTMDSSVVNRAIVSRWSLAALEYIKKAAWKRAEARAQAEVAAQQQREREAMTR